MDRRRRRACASRLLPVLALIAMGAPRPSWAGGCTRIDGASAGQYLAGDACPPDGFPYAPSIAETASGPRAVDPYTDGCSNVRTRGRTFDFTFACGTHDYGYDLLRFRVAVPRDDIDAILREDMTADCATRDARVARLCSARARTYAAGVRSWTAIEGQTPSGPINTGRP